MFSFPCLILSPPRPFLHLQFFNHHDFAKIALNVSFASCAFKSCSLLGQTFHLMSGITVFSRLCSRFVCLSFYDLLLLFYSSIVPNSDYSRHLFEGIQRDSHPNFPLDTCECSDSRTTALELMCNRFCKCLCCFPEVGCHCDPQRICRESIFD